MITDTLNEPMIKESKFYPLTRDEVLKLKDLKLSPTAGWLLLYIKARAPFGTKIAFDNDLNQKVIQEELGMNRNTFWRAKKELLELSLIEFDEYSMRDCQTVSRPLPVQPRPQSAIAANHFHPNPSLVQKPSLPAEFMALSSFQVKHQPDPDSAKAEVAKLPNCAERDLPIDSAKPESFVTKPELIVASSKPSSQFCNDRSPEPNQSDASISSILSRLENLKKTTRHSHPTHPVVCSSEKGEPIKKQPESSENHFSDNEAKARDQGVKPKPLSREPLLPGPFLEFEPELKKFGVRFNQNLLKEFHKAGVDKVREAISYLVDKLAKAPDSVDQVGGYLVSLLRNGENLVQETCDELTAKNSALIRWIKYAVQKRIVTATIADRGVAVLRETLEYVPFAEAMERFPIDPDWVDTSS